MNHGREGGFRVQAVQKAGALIPTIQAFEAFVTPKCLVQYFGFCRSAWKPFQVILHPGQGRPKVAKAILVKSGQGQMSFADGGQGFVTGCFVAGYSQHQIFGCSR